jgi:2-hydroxy-3-oxopropionate reductase
VTAVAVLGLGVIGGAMAANLLRAGHEVVGFNRSRAAVERLVAAGGQGADSVAEAVRDADVVLTALPEGPDVLGVVLGDGGVLSAARPGTLLVDHSTIAPGEAVRLADAARAAGLRPLDAPVSGGEAGAVEGTLSIMIGGEAEDVAAARPVLEVLGTTVVHVGPSGAGQIVKAANQLLVAGTIELVAEALVFLEAQVLSDGRGVDTEAGLRVLAGGLAGNRVLDRKGASMRARDFRPGGRVDLHHKDLGIVLAAAREAGVAVPLGAVVTQLMGAVRAQGHGSLDHTALLLLVEQLSGRGPTVSPADGSTASP